MKVSNVEKKDNKLDFVLEDTTPAFANALRRIMLAEVPVLAIDDVTIFENNSPLYDEVLAHRIGLLAIKTDLKTFKLPSECTCKGKGCPKCQVSFTLVKKGPGTVYSGDLKPSDPKTIVADKNIPLTKLNEGQKIKIEAIAMLGQGKVHAKWQAAVVSYGYEKDKNAFRFHVESHGGLSPDKIVTEAARILGDKAKEVAKLVK
jgi:DNA-directed RNA polymerase subunit D